MGASREDGPSPRGHSGSSYNEPGIQNYRSTGSAAQFNEHYAELSFSNGDAIFFALHIDFIITMETREQGVRVLHEKAVTVQPIGEAFASKEGQLCARLIRIDDNGRNSPSDLIAAVKGVTLAALMEADLGEHSAQLDVRWSKIYESKTAAALLKEADRRDRKAEVEALRKVGKARRRKLILRSETSMKWWLLRWCLLALSKTGHTGNKCRGPFI